MKYRLMTAKEVESFTGAHHHTVYTWAEKLKDTDMAHRDESNEWHINPVLAVLVKARANNRAPLKIDNKEAVDAVVAWTKGNSVQEIRQETGVNATHLGLDALDRDEIEAFLSKWVIPEEEEIEE